MNISVTFIMHIFQMDLHNLTVSFANITMQERSEMSLEIDSEQDELSEMEEGSVCQVNLLSN